MARTPTTSTNIPPQADQRKVEWVPLSRLRLDPLNPRLPEGLEDATQATLLATLARDYDLQDIAQSIADNGYFAEEPLVGIQNPDGKTWTVVEGNRRLAILLLLEEPARAPRELRDRWAALSAERKVAVTSAPLLVYNTRPEITPYLGFRHVTGVLPWKPYPKARFIAHLVERDKMSFGSIARTIGSRPNTVREHYVAYTIVRQSRDEFLIDTSNAEELFGVLRRAMSDPNIRKFIGLDLDRPEAALAKPLNKSKAKSAEEFFRYAFGLGDISPSLGESRDLSKLGAVLANTHSLDALRTTGDLDYAFALSGGEEKKLLEHINTAGFHLDQALPLSIRHHGNKGIIAALRRCRQTLNEIVRHFPESAL